MNSTAERPVLASQYKKNIDILKHVTVEFEGSRFVLPQEEKANGKAYCCL